MFIRLDIVHSTRQLAFKIIISFEIFLQEIWLLQRCFVQYSHRFSL